MSELMIPFELCDFAEVDAALPIEIARRKLLRMTNDGRFPKCVRPDGRKSPPLWRRDEVMKWIRERYGAILPEHVADMEVTFIRPKKGHQRAK